MNQAAERIKMLLGDDPKRSEYIFKGITIVAIAASLTLILIMLIANPSGRAGTPPVEPDFSTAIDRKIINHAEREPGNPSSMQPADQTANADEDADNSDTAGEAGHEETSHGESGEHDLLTLSLTDAEASDLLAFAFSRRFPITDVKVSFHAPNTVKVKGNMEKEKLGEMFSEQDLPLLRAALILAPDVLEGELVFSLSLGNGTLTATPERISINRMNLTRFVPPEAVESANEALRSLIPEQTSLRSLTIDDGSISFTLQRQ